MNPGNVHSKYARPQFASARAISSVCAALAVTIGMVAIVGWVLDMDVLKGAIGVPITMKFNAACCLVLCGLSLIGKIDETRRAFWPNALASIALLVSGATGFEHLTNQDLGIDQLVFHEAPGAAATSSPNRMGPPATISFILLSVTILLLNFGKFRNVRVILPAGSLLINLISIVGYVFGAAGLYAVSARTGIAWPTGVSLLMLSVGVITARSDNMIVRLLSARDLGGAAARWLLPPAILFPILLLLLYSQIRDAELVDAVSGRAILAVVIVVGMATIVFITAARIGRVSQRQLQTESDLRRSQLELRDLFENATVGLHFADADGVIRQANRAAVEMLGYDTEEYVNRPFAEFHVNRSVAEDALATLKRGASVTNVQTSLRCRNGSVRQVLIDMGGMWENGELKHIRCFTKDITDSKQIQDIADRLSAIVESSNDAIIGEDLNGCIISWNPAAEQLFGYTRDEVIGRSISMLIPPERAGDERRGLDRIRNGEKVEHYETIRRRKDGTIVDVSLTLSPIRNWEGKLVGASKIVRDITEQAQLARQREALLEKERGARREAEHAGKMRTDFLAVVSHELRTPLNSILGWSQLLRRAQHDPELVKEGIESIERGARAQAQLIEDLLDMNRIMAEKLKLDLRPVAVGAIVESAVALMRPAAEAKRISLEIKISDSLGLIRGDATRLQQVLWNLLSNAVKFSRAGGTIRIAAAASPAHVEISVQDDGIGIPAEFLPHVFEPFRQADSSTTRSHGGLGLGLAIAKQLVEMHGGEIRAESDGLQKGARFMVRLPFLDQEASGRALAPRPSDLSVGEGMGGIKLAGIKVLVVDDQLDTRELLDRLIRQWGGEVVLAASAEEALAAILAQRMAGTDAARLARECGGNPLLALELARAELAGGGESGGS
ncbi:MAG: PAS domain S-box protein, partial [Phycisphaerales bacterium]|nr:PAS domain S-box protein [Phycisphaerales bacterium]